MCADHFEVEWADSAGLGGFGLYPVQQLVEDGLRRGAGEVPSEQVQKKQLPSLKLIGQLGNVLKLT